MKNQLLIILTSFLICFNSMATHNRAGEIIYEHINGYTYLFTVVTYTYTKSPADRDQLKIQIGDEAVITAPRDTFTYLQGTTYKYNIYKQKYTFATPGVYEIIVEDPNRNLDVKNIPNSVYVPFSIRTVMMINPEIGPNNAPELLSPPIHRAALNRTFIHNPVTFDKDGDDLTYRLTTCTGENGQPIHNYSIPEASDTFMIDAISGKMVWNTPVETGKYNVAIAIEEWRKGLRIGSITRDMQIEVYENNNHPPVFNQIKNFCVYVGDTIQFEIEIRDEDNNNIKCDALGGPFEFGNSKPVFKEITSIKGYAKYSFFWVPTCEYVRDKEYMIGFVAEDDYLDINVATKDTLDLRLANSVEFLVKVTSPPPEILSSQSYANSIGLTWEYDVCNDVSYNIFRNRKKTNYSPDSCYNFIPLSEGFEFAGTSDKKSFLDNNNGKGLPQGYEYCYLVTAVFKNRSQSMPSKEYCAYLTPSIPNIIETSVTKIDSAEGIISLKWIKPRRLDTLGFTGPFLYKINRGNTLSGESFDLISTSSNLDDTLFIDTLNTIKYPYSYMVELYNNEPGEKARIGNPGIASTLYADYEASNKKLKLLFMRNVPWINIKYEIFRQDNPNENFKLVGQTINEFYIDSNLINNKVYWYKLKSYGKYIQNITDTITFINENLSHKTFGIPVDTIRPATPLISVNQDCEKEINYISWVNQATEGIYEWILEYKPNIYAEFDSSITFKGNVNSYAHPHTYSSSYIYRLWAIDSSGNHSIQPAEAKVDVCLNFELPNVFTPNADGINDIYKPVKIGTAVEKTEMKIYNRWGVLVYETEKNIFWNGYLPDSKKLVPVGVYYYVCDAYAHGLYGLQPYNFIGFIHVLMEEGAKNINE